jgi:outer membrane receptor for ferrienterochelin and colicins
MLRKTLVCSAAALLSAMPAAAEMAQDLEEIIVTATTREQQVRTAPASISVVTKAELETRFVDDLSDALSTMEGVNVTGIGMTRKGVSLRGMPVEHTLYLLDGRRVSASGAVVAHSDYELSWLPTSAIERIEVVRGPMSSLYGSDALGGVINVITRVPSDELTGEVSADATRLESGDDGASYKLSGYLGGPIIKDKLSFVLAGQYFDRSDLPLEEDEQLSEVEGRESAGGFGSLIWTPSEGQRLSVSFSRNDDDRWRDTQSGPTYYQYRDDVEREQLSLAYSGIWSWGQLVFNAYQSEMERINTRTNGQTPTRPQGVKDRVADGRVSIPLGSHHLTAGGQLREEKLYDSIAASSGESAAAQNAFFLQDEFSLTDSLALTGGVRFDHHEFFGWESSPRAYAVWSINDKLVLKGGYGQGFRAPTLSQLSPDYRVLAAGGRFWVLGNPDLNPETSESFEASLSYNEENWSLIGTVYRNTLDNLVEALCVSDCGMRGREIRLYQNISSSRIRGVELAASATVAERLTLDANYSYTEAENRETGEPLGNRPKHRANLSAGWQIGADGLLRARAELYGKQDDGAGETTPSYALLHADFVVEINPGIRLRGGVENLLDERLAEKSELFTFAEPGRQYRLGITVGF